ncbi:sensor histidine kinase [Bacillus sp. 1P06AnD]|uniref:sensor histidine kinase n=1 Tax=Bacillus sp. 1P06AnD TaxID=3132208 RepID=UPI0039A3655C
MKRLKLFHKFFLYTFSVMLFFVVLIHGLIYILAPQMQLEFTPTMDVSGDLTVTIAREEIVTEAVQRALPISLSCSLIMSVMCSFLLAKRIANPIQSISISTERMRKLDKSVRCTIQSKDEIGLLAMNINELYLNLMFTIEQLERERDYISELERSKVDFLRTASHELKTPVTALNATLENMILGVGKYQDYAFYLPECKEMVEQLATMIHDILDTSKLNMIVQQEQPVETDLSEIIKELCEPYKLIAEAQQITFSLRLPESLTVNILVKEFSKAISNILANAVAYTEAGKSVSVYISENTLIIENECVPVDKGEIPRLFLPFYRPDYSRSRDSGGNGLGLYIVDTIFKSLQIKYTFAQMEKQNGMRFTIQL